MAYRYYNFCLEFSSTVIEDGSHFTFRGTYKNINSTQDSKIEYRFVDFFETVKRLFQVNYSYYLK